MEHVVESAAVENHAAEEEKLSLKEYWSHVWELMKYFFKYFGIAIAETAKRFWGRIMKWAKKCHLVNEVDEDGNIIDDEYVYDEDVNDDDDTDDEEFFDSDEAFKKEDDATAEAILGFSEQDPNKMTIK